MDWRYPKISVLMLVCLACMLSGCKAEEAPAANADRKQIHVPVHEATEPGCVSFAAAGYSFRCVAFWKAGDIGLSAVTESASVLVVNSTLYPLAASNIVYGLDAVQGGRVLWRVAMEGLAFRPRSISNQEGIAAIGGWSADLFAIDVRDGSIRWAFSRVNPYHDRDAGRVDEPVVLDDVTGDGISDLLTVWIPGGQPQEKAQRLYLVDGATGAVVDLWEIPVDQQYYHLVDVVQDGQSYLVLLSATACQKAGTVLYEWTPSSPGGRLRRLWSLDIDRKLHAQMENGSDVIYGATQNGKVLAITTRFGKILWQRAATDTTAIYVPPVQLDWMGKRAVLTIVHRGKFPDIDAAHAIIHDIGDGHVLADVTLSGIDLESRPLMLDSASVLWLTGDGFDSDSYKGTAGTLWIADGRAGKVSELARFDGFANGVQRIGNLLYVSTSRGLYAYSIARPE